MTTPKPKLVTFAASHFCEKARWALDWHGISYEEVGWPPGLHQILAKRAGAKAATVPMVLEADDVIQGSGNIIDWAEKKDRNQDRSLTPKAHSAAAMEIERRADEVIGPHVRRLQLAEFLPAQSNQIRPAFFYHASGWRSLAGVMMWPVAWRVMMRMYDIRPGTAAESRAKLEEEFDWLDAKLADGRTYLVGDYFSRADLTVAGLLAFFAQPNKFSPHHAISGPESFVSDLDRWSKRPVMAWVRRQYEMHRTT